MEIVGDHTKRLKSSLLLTNWGTLMQLGWSPNDQPEIWHSTQYGSLDAKVRYEKLMDRIAVHYCEHVREYTDQPLGV